MEGHPSPCCSGGSLLFYPFFFFLFLATLSLIGSCFLTPLHTCTSRFISFLLVAKCEQQPNCPKYFLMPIILQVSKNMRRKLSQTLEKLMSTAQCRGEPQSNKVFMEQICPGLPRTHKSPHLSRKPSCHP